MPRRARNNQPNFAARNSAALVCAKKRAFTSKALAEAAAEYKTAEDSSVDLRVYICGNCGKWHLTRNR